VERYNINVPGAVLDDLRHRLDNIRWTDDFANDDWYPRTGRLLARAGTVHERLPISAEDTYYCFQICC